jgi:hypothetical protein
MWEVLLQRTQAQSDQLLEINGIRVGEAALANSEESLFQEPKIGNSVD